MKRMIKWCLLLALYCWLFGCGGGGSDGAHSGSLLTAKQIEEIENSSKSITDKLSTAAEPGSETALNDAKSFALTLPNVQSADLIEGNLVVKYKGAGREIWLENSPTSTMPADIPELQALASKSALAKAKAIQAPVGNLNAVLINTLSEDPGFSDANQSFAGMKSVLEGIGYNVKSLDGPEASPDNMAKLSEYSVLVLNAHGGFVKNENNEEIYVTSTGKEWDYTDTTKWLDDTTVKVTVRWGAGLQRVFPNKSLYGVTGKFWKNAYGNDHFTRALFFNGACSGAKTASFRNDLSEIGIVAYTGWTNTTSKSSAATWRIIALMAGGKSLQEAVDLLPDDYKTESVSEHWWNPLLVTSSLWFGPDNEKSITLAAINPSHPEITIDTPTNGISVADRRCVVTGRITPNTGYSFANIMVNGQSELLSINSDGSFDQAVGLRAGDNVITISTRGDVEYQKSVTVTGVFSSDILFTSLWWNTDLSDIDLHLVPIEGANGARDECFFGNMISTWGATLDVDDVDGFGPEHITARTLPPGKYLLYVHYFATHGQTAPTTVNVAVSVQGQQSIIFSLNGDRRMLNQGDVWRVCTIEFTSGAIQTLDEFLPDNRTVSFTGALRSKK
jgi:uncharacterized protein YfaP (DUF2135 family)